LSVEYSLDVEQRAAMLVDYGAMVAASADVNAVTTLDGTYRYVSPACERLFGWPPDELVGHRHDDFVHPDDAPLLRAAAKGLADEAVTTTTYRFRTVSGRYRWVEETSRCVDLTRSEPLIVSSTRDIAERTESHVVLERLASTDPLTGLANRIVLMDRLRQELLRLERGAGIVAVLYLDLDRFKVVNDSLGHQIGDAVLLQMAERLVKYLRPTDTLARLGGDEFVIVAGGVVDETAAAELGSRIIEVGRQPFTIGTEEYSCTLSVGIASTADAHYSSDALLQEADLALYRAKDHGRDRFEVFDDDLRTAEVGRLATSRMLHRALDEGRVVVEYQPIIDIARRRVVGAEALVRVRDAAGMLLGPSAFLAVADETGLLTHIDDWVTDVAIDQAAGWHRRCQGSEPAEMALNVTARRIADAGFAGALVARLDACGLAHDVLQAEVTERVLMEASNSAMVGLRALRDAGVRVGLDGFGTGYFSLVSLRQFPLDFVKIDRSLIDGMTRTTGEQAMISAIIEFSHAMGLVVVAVGVESQAQFDLLEALGCDRAQGFLLGRPGPASTLTGGGLRDR